MRKQFASEGADVVQMSAAEFGAYMASEHDQMGPRRQAGRHQGAVRTSSPHPDMQVAEAWILARLKTGFSPRLSGASRSNEAPGVHHVSAARRRHAAARRARSRPSGCGASAC